MALISIIVPVYSVEKCLHRCVDSILGQSFSDFELILIDDGSPDKSPKICDEYAEKDRRVVVIHQENGGIAAARNAGIRWVAMNSVSKWVIFVDSDDMIHHQMLELLYKAVHESDADIGLCSPIEAHDIPEDFDRELCPSISCHEVDESYMLDLYQNGKHRYWVAWAKLVKKEIVVAMQFEEGRIFEDNNLIFKWLCEARRIADVDAELYFYYVNNSGISKGSFSTKHLDFLHALKTQEQFYWKIKYYRLHEKICANYLMSAVTMYFKIQRELENKVASKRVKRDIRFFCVVKLPYIKLNRGEILRLLEMLHPHIVGCYWRLKAIKRVFQDQGIFSLVRRFGEKLWRKKNDT